jgi:membrane protease YdiL (CAAX protease family)
MRDHLRRHRLAWFFGLTYLFSWGYWIPCALAGGHVSHFPGLLGPMLAALVVRAVTEGATGVRGAWTDMTRWRVDRRWYGFALLPLVPAVCALLIWWALPIEGPTLAGISHMPGLPDSTVLGTFTLCFLINGYGEETGWRGYAIPRLRERHDPLTASLLLAIPWAAWHIPTFFLDTGMRGFSPFLLPGFLVGMAAGSIVLTWMVEGSRSILVVALWHAALNMGSATDAASSVAVLTTALVIVWAIRIARGWYAAETGPRAAALRAAG